MSSPRESTWTIGLKRTENSLIYKQSIQVVEGELWHKPKKIGRSYASTFEVKCQHKHQSCSSYIHFLFDFLLLRSASHAHTHSTNRTISPRLLHSWRQKLIWLLFLAATLINSILPLARCLSFPSPPSLITFQSVSFHYYVLDFFLSFFSHIFLHCNELNSNFK